MAKEAEPAGKGMREMTNLRKLVLAAVIAAPLALCAAEKPAQQTATDASAPPPAATTQSQPARHGFRKVLHGLNPSTWAAYLSKKEYCTYAYQQAYGVCEGSRSR